MNIGSKHAIRFLTLLASIFSAFVFADFLPYEVRSYSYAVSLSIKETLVFTLPFIVFSIVFQSTSKLRGSNAVKVVLLLLTMVMLSNSLSIGVAHLVGKFGAAHLAPNLVYTDALSSEGLVPKFTMQLPSVISSIKAVLLGFICGMVLPRIMGKTSARLSETLARISVFVLENILVPVLPVFVVGLVFKMQSDNLIGLLLSNAKVALFLFGIALLHVFLLYMLASGFSVLRALQKLRDMLPTALFAFTTMSSLITMPVILKAVKKNSNDPELMDIAVPTALNVHLVGDCFFMIVMSIVIALAFNGAEPVSLASYIYFLLYFLISKFAVVAIPGGGIIVMIPIIEQYLNFSPTMLSLITTLYFVFDPAITAVNVMGNGAFTMLFSKTYTKLFKKEARETK
ncbi:MAG: cation:dicarboxylase symporter family transporter [Aaplasma endosymbiont of Hyalomma asiaticum]